MKKKERIEAIASTLLDSVHRQNIKDVAEYRVPEIKDNVWRKHVRSVVNLAEELVNEIDSRNYPSQYDPIQK